MSGVDYMETDHLSLNSCLFAAVKNGDEAKVHHFLSNEGIDINSKVEGQLTCIHVAVEKGLSNICEYLIKNGANVNSRYPVEEFDEGSTLLYRAASKGHAAVVELLLIHGAQVSAKNSGGATSLHIAVEKNFPEVVKTLIEKGAKVNDQRIPVDTVDHYQMNFKENNLIIGTLKLDTVDVSSISVYEGAFFPLHIAVKRGHEEIVKLLLKSGANVDIADDNGETALSFAARKGCLRMLNHVLSHFPDKNLVGNRRVLALAVKFKGEMFQNIILKLLDYGLLYDDELFQHDYHHNICVKEQLPPSPQNLQRTFLDVAAENGHFSVVRRLMRDVPSARLSVKSCASRCLVVSIDGGSEDDINFFLDCGADVNSRGLYNRDPPLLQAVRKSDVRIAKLLIRSGAKVRGNSALLSSAADSGCLEMVKLLLKHGANINGTSTVGNQKLCSVSKWCRYLPLHENHTDFSDLFISPLFMAASGGHKDLVKLLLENGATVDSKNAYGLTPLLISVVGQHLETAELLLKSGARIGSTGPDDRTALHIAAELGYTDIIKLLLRFGAEIEAMVRCRKRGDILTPLLFAAKEGHLTTVEALLNCGASVNFSQTGSMTALGLAAENGHAAVVKTLLEDDASLNYKFKNGRTALFFAIEGSHIETVQTLLEYGANVNITDYKMERPLQIAIRKESDQMVELLFNYGAEFKELDLCEKRTYLRDAVISGNLKIVEAFIKKGFTLDHPILVADAILSVAVKNGLIKIAKLLFDNGIRFNSDMERDQCFLMSAKRGCLNAFEFLFECGASVHCANSNGETALHFAAKSGDSNILKRLLVYESDVNAATREGETPLTLSAKAGFLAITEILIKGGACLETADHHGRTALFSAAEWGHADVLRLLMDNGADTNCRANSGETLVLIAAKRGHFGILKLLIKHGANVNASNIDGETALHFATEYCEESAVRLLLKNNANVNSTTKIGKTPVFISAERGHLELVDFLIKFDANINVTDEDGFTPLLFAVESGHADVVELLLEHGADVCCDTRGNIPLLLTAAKLESAKTVEVLIDFGLVFELFNGDIKFLEPYFSGALSNGEKFNGFFKLLLCGSGNNNFVSKRTVDILFNIISNVYSKSVSVATASGCKRLAGILERFYVKLKAIGLYNDLEVKNTAPFTYRKTHEDFETDCMIELVIMSSKIIAGFDSNVTIYNIFTSNLSRLASIARNERVQPFLMSQDFTVRFPKYRHIVRNLFNKGALRRKLLDRCTRAFRSTSGVISSLPIDVIENILLHLQNQDLRVALKACCLLSS